MLDSLGHWETGLGPGPPSAHLPHETRARNVLVFLLISQILWEVWWEHAE